MSDAKPTPGRWSVEDTGSPADTLQIVARADQPVYHWQFLAMATADPDNGVDWTATQANARLLAAAPDLLHACMGLLWLLDRQAECPACKGEPLAEHSCPPQDAYESNIGLARDALAKAGES